MRSIGTRVAPWQIALVLLFPLLYVFNARMPWAEGLWIGLDKAYFVPFWTSIVAIHGMGALLVLLILRRSRVPAAAVGFHLSVKRALIVLVALAGVGLAAVAAREILPYGHTDVLGFDIGWPASTRERIFWVGVSLSAGICEELMFRGFAIPALESRGFKTWQAVLISMLSFSLVTGASNLTIFGITLASGLVFSGVYLWRRNLALVMAVHVLSDLSFILLP